MGALLAGASEEDLGRMSLYATPLGEAFQIQDDVLDLFGTTRKTGKPVGSDIRAGKRTHLVLRALRTAPPEDRAFLEQKLGDRHLSDDDLERVRDVVRNSGALDFAVQRARRLGEQARTALEGCRWKGEGRSFLEGAVAFVLERDT